MSKSIKGHAGFSLVELLVAVLVLAIGLLGLAELQISTMRANSQSESIMAGNHLAQKIVEEIVAAPGDDPRFSPPATVNNVAWIPPSFDIEGGGTYNVTYDVAVSHGGVEGLSQITVKVASPGLMMTMLGVRPRQVTMTTLKRTY